MEFTDLTNEQLEAILKERKNDNEFIGDAVTFGLKDAIKNMKTNEVIPIPSLYSPDDLKPILESILTTSHPDRWKVFIKRAEFIDGAEVRYMKTLNNRVKVFLRFNRTKI